MQNVAKATYREILERRAGENRIDFIDGVATALTPLAFFEIVMHMAFRSVVEDGGDVSVETGLRAAEKLQAVHDKRDPGDDIADMRRQVNMILDAVKAVVPQEMWGDIAEKLDQLEQHREVLDAETEDFDDRGRIRSDRVHRRGRRVLTSAAPAVPEGNKTAAGVAGAFAVTPTRATSSGDAGSSLRGRMPHPVESCN